MRPFQLLILLFLTSCTAHDTSNKSNDSKAVDTLSNGLRIINTIMDSVHYYKDQVGTDSLLGNCQLVYAENDTTYFLYFKRGDTLNLLNQTDNSTSLHHLGNLVQDTTSFFILGHDQGNGSPYTYEYIDKRTGKNPLGWGTAFLDYKLLNDTPYLLYSDTVINDKTRLTLFNTANKKKEFYDLQDGYWELFIDTLTSKKLAIKYTTDRNKDSTKVKMYSR